MVTEGEEDPGTKSPASAWAPPLRGDGVAAASRVPSPGHRHGERPGGTFLHEDYKILLISANPRNMCKNGF